MDEGEIGRVCPPVTLTMVMVQLLLEIRDGRRLPLGRRDGEAKVVGGS